MDPFSPSQFPTPIAEHFMFQAYELAVSAMKHDEVPIGALLVNQQEILGCGANGREKSGRTTAHAEIMALEDYNRRTGQWRLPPGTAIFTTVEPCLMCTGALLWARADYVIYGCLDSRHAGLERVLPLIHHGVYDHRFKEVQGGVLGERCSQLMTGYFRAKRQEKSHPSAEVSR